jgi:hypothetical protein
MTTARQVRPARFPLIDHVNGQPKIPVPLHRVHGKVQVQVDGKHFGPFFLDSKR